MQTDHSNAGAPPIFSQCAQHIAVAANSFDALMVNASRLAFAAAMADPRGYLVRYRPVASLLAAALVMLTPAHAWAQDWRQQGTTEDPSVRGRARPDYDPLGLRLGGFDLNASVDFAVTSTDNVFVTETNEQDDIIFSVSPVARLSSHWSRHAASVEGGADFTSHQDFSDEDAQTGYLAADGRLDVGSNSALYAGGRLARQVEPRTNADALAIADPVEYDRTEAYVGAEHEFNRVRLRGTFATVEYDYDDAGGIDQDFRDSDETSGTIRADVELTPRIGLIGEVRLDERTYDNQPGLSSDGQTYLAGVNVNLTDLMVGELTVGQFTREYDSGAEVEGTAIAASLEWYITRLTTLGLEARRNAEDSGATVALPYVESQYAVRVDHELRRNVLLMGQVQFGQREYDSIDRNDDFINVEVGADYLLNRRVVLRGRYAYLETESTGADRYRDFEVNLLTLGLSLRL